MAEQHKSRPLNEEKIELALREYEALWRYYCHTLDNQNSAIRTYLFVISLPSAIVAAAAEKSDLAGWLNPYAWVLILALAIAGFTIITTYEGERRNSDLYIHAMNSIRSTLFRQFDEIVLIHQLRVGVERGFRIGSWRVWSIVVLNSTTFAMSGCMAMMTLLPDLLRNPPLCLTKELLLALLFVAVGVATFIIQLALSDRFCGAYGDEEAVTRVQAQVGRVASPLNSEAKSHCGSGR